MSKRNDLSGQILELAGETPEGLTALVKHVLNVLTIDQLEDVLADLYDVKPAPDEEEEDAEEEDDIDDDVDEDFDDDD